MVTRNIFGQLQTGEPVQLYRITNIKGEYIELLNYGASMQSICVKDKSGHIDDVLLGTDDGNRIANYLFLGATIGRCANRVKEGRFKIGERAYQLEVDKSGNSMHSGSANFAHRMFEAEIQGENTVVFSLEDDGRGGFECEAKIKVCYIFDDDSQITMRYEMVANGDTIFNPTNHAYFNLCGSGSDARRQVLMVNAREKAACDETKVPNGQTVVIERTPFDFEQPSVIQDTMGDLTGYDEYYIRDKLGYGLAAELLSRESGRKMSVYTDLPCIVVCMFPVRHAVPGKNGTNYMGYPFVCIEPQFVPNAVNCPNFDKPVFHKGEVFTAKTVYAFGVVN